MASLLPLLLDLADELTVTPYHRTNHFGFGIHPDNVRLISSPRVTRTSLLPYTTRRKAINDNRRSRKNICNGNIGNETTGKDGFQVCMDVEDFAPNEITVKTVNNDIVVEAKHEEREDDHGYISRQFTRRYTLPDGYNVKDVVSKLSSDGILTVQAPAVEKTDDGSKVRVIQIQQTGPAIENVAKDVQSSQDKAEATEKTTKTAKTRKAE